MTESKENAVTWSSMEFVQIPASTYAVGLRWEEALSEHAQAALREFAEPDQVAEWFSPSRTVALAEFKIAQTTMDAESLLAESDEKDEDYLRSMSALCASLNRALARHGCRLPTEDELEVACGDSLFYWGNEIPDGSPWHTETTFRAHTLPNALGL